MKHIRHGGRSSRSLYFLFGSHSPAGRVFPLPNYKDFTDSHKRKQKDGSGKNRTTELAMGGEYWAKFALDPRYDRTDTKEYPRNSHLSARYRGSPKSVDRTASSHSTSAGPRQTAP